MEDRLPAGVQPPSDDLDEYVASTSAEELERFVKLLHPSDVGDLLGEVDRKHWPKVLELLGDERLAAVVVALEGGVQDDLLEYLGPRLGVLLEELESDDAADLVALVPEEKRDQLVAELKTQDPEDAEAVERLLQYGEDTAGGIMQTELCAVSRDARVSDAIAEVRKLSHEVGNTLHRLYITDSEERLVGQVPLLSLLIARDDDPVESVMEPARYQVGPEVDQEEVAAMFQRYDLVTLPVVDEERRILGRILHDDILDVMEEEADEDVMRMVGASEEDLVYSDRIFRISAYRLPWLVVNLLGGLFTGWLMWRFKATLHEVLALVTFVPVITAMGGNVGIQSSTILTRGFATGRVDKDNLSRVFLKEVLVGLTMGTICGLVVALAATLWHGSPVLGAVVGVSMFAAMLTATTIGTLAPATFQRFNIDPAIAAGPFVTTANDITGILIYFGTATFFLDLLKG